MPSGKANYKRRTGGKPKEVVVGLGVLCVIEPRENVCFQEDTT